MRAELLECIHACRVTLLATYRASISRESQVSESVQKVKIRPVGDILRQPKAHGALARVLQKLQQTKQLADIIYPCLPNELAKHCFVRHMYENSISMECDNAAWANQLRYYVPEILKYLQQDPNYAHIVKVSCKVKVE